MPKPYNGIFQAYKSSIPAVLKQSKDKNDFIDVELPTTNQ